jgi:hypothetical protein
MEIIVPDLDKQFFAQHGDRYAHIRMPRKVLAKNNQRAVQYVDECEIEFRSLGEHDASRRRILLWRVPGDNYFYNPDKPQIIKIPFLVFSDESIADTDEVLLPLIHEIMIDAAKEQKVI